MYVDSGLRVFSLFSVLCSLVLLFSAGNVNAATNTKFDLGLRPRFFPRDRLVTLPIIARDVVARPPAGRNGTANDTQPSVQSSAGWTTTQTSDRQSYYALLKVADINFRIVLDTGSSDLWLLSSACGTDACKSLPKYPLSYQSPSFQSVNGNATAYSANYADGSAVSGMVAREKVELAGLVVANQTIGLISNSTVLLNDQESGILGLGFPRLSTISTNAVNGSIPFFASVAQQGLLNYPLFGFSLTRNLTGSLSLGAIDASIVTDPRQIGWNAVAQFSPNAAESNMSSYLHWAIPLASIGVNGKQLAPVPSQAQATGNISFALFDVGTPGLYGSSMQPVSCLLLLIFKLNGRQGGQWVVPCDTSVPISLTFGSHEYILQPSDYLIGPASGNPNLCISWPRALPPSADGLDWQIGTAFLQTVYTIFNYGINSKEPPKIGLYPLDSNISSPNTAATPSASAQPSPTSITPFIPQTTIPTTLPNFLIPTPTFTTPSYMYNTSVPATIGGIVNSGLATSTYKPILAHAQATTGFNASAIPTISPSPSVVTLTTNGMTIVSTFPAAAVTLGLPPGYISSGLSLSSSFGMTVVVALSVQVLVVSGLFSGWVEL
ncbi:Aspartic protease [Leucoagaricus sp. SymC.cos]|nr:Aspartic protease [Leucoagaricus sp. SymC.cos]